jgi:hypothetical protein
VENPAKGLDWLLRKKADHYISDLEYQYMKVELPDPIYGKRTRITFKAEHTNAWLDYENKRKFLNNIGHGIRSHIREADLDEAAKYLAALLELVEDGNSRIAFLAAQQLYRLGDYEEKAYSKLKELIKTTPVYEHSVSQQTKSTDFNELLNNAQKKASDPDNLDYSEIIKDLLQDFIIFNDDRFNDVIYDKWLELRSEEKLVKDSKFVDLAYFLEKNNKEIPIDYWYERLNNFRGLKHTFDVLDSRLDDSVKPGLKKVLESKKVRTNPHKASAARFLFKLTGEEVYSNYLRDQSLALKESYISESYNDTVTMEESLSSYIRIDALKALEIVKVVRRGGILDKAALDALAASKNSITTDFIGDEILEHLKKRHGFPYKELEVLVKQNTEYSGVKYQELKGLIKDPTNRLIDGRVWTDYDFRKIDFQRKYGVGTWK